MNYDSKKNRLNIVRAFISHLFAMHILKIILAIGLFALGPALQCWRFPDWLWISVVVSGALLFFDGELGLIGGKDKLNVFKSRKKFIIFIVSSFAGAALFVMLYIAILVILFPPI